MQYTLDHLVINVPDVRTSAATYRSQFGGQILAQTPHEVWLYHDDPVLLVLRQSDGTTGIHYAAYRVDSAVAAFTDLMSKGARKAWDLTDDGPIRHCGFYDADGLPFRVFSAQPDERRILAPSTPAVPTWLRLHHVNILTHDVRRAVHFYEHMLGLRVALTYQPDFSGFNFLIDAAFDHHEHNFMLEVTGPPELDEREAAYLEAHGPSYDHICFITADPVRAYHRLVNNGAPSLYEPQELYGTVLAWVQDPQQVHVELMKPIPDELLAGVLRGEPPLCFAALAREETHDDRNQGPN